MANFVPLKNYFLYCLDEMIAEKKLQSPFIDIGCGVGDVSVHLAKKGWSGKAIDFSDEAIKQAKKRLMNFPGVTVEKKSLYDEEGIYKSIMLWDVIEHLEEDEKALQKIQTLLADDGYLLISVPSNPREWRWDDEFYGHFRRYTTQDMTKVLNKAGLTPVIFWDTTFPLFWIMRRLYTRLKKPPTIEEDKIENTKASATVNAFEVGFLTKLLNKEYFFWKLLYKIQFSLFRKMLARGHGMFVLAKKTTAST